MRWFLSKWSKDEVTNVCRLMVTQLDQCHSAMSTLIFSLLSTSISENRRKVKERFRSWAVKCNGGANEICPLHSVLHHGQHFLASSDKSLIRIEWARKRSCCTFAIWLVSTTSFILGWIFLDCCLAYDIFELLVSQLAPDTKKRSLCHPLMDTNDKRNFYCELNLIVTQLSISMIRRKKVDTSDIKSEVLTYFQSAEATICCHVSSGARLLLLCLV